MIATDSHAIYAQKISASSLDRSKIPNAISAQAAMLAYVRYISIINKQSWITLHPSGLFHGNLNESPQHGLPNNSSTGDTACSRSTR